MEAHDRVIQKSMELFTQYGIRQVTMDQIAEELGMSKRTIYELFKDKDTLVAECIETMFTLYNEEIRNIIAGASNVIEALYLLGQHGQKKRASVNRLYFEDLRKYYPGLHESIMKRTRPGKGSFSCSIITKGIEEGIFQADLNIEIVDSFLYMMMESFHKKGIYPENTTEKEVLRNIIIPYYLGISTEKGKKIIEQYIPLTLN